MGVVSVGSPHRPPQRTIYTVIRLTPAQRGTRMQPRYDNSPPRHAVFPMRLMRTGRAAYDMGWNGAPRSHAVAVDSYHMCELCICA